jgi:hypothetical protein
MTDSQTKSWIFLSTAIASQSESADFRSISNIADGINHAVPSQKELQSSLTWLIVMGLVAKNGNKYKLTDKGKRDYEAACRQTSIILKVWNNLETVLLNY